MDIDPGTVIFVSFSFSILLNSFSDVRATSLPVRRLPFSMVPGIITHSRPFLKAVSLIAKQTEVSNRVSKSLDTPNISSSSSKGKKKVNGTFSCVSSTCFIV